MYNIQGRHSISPASEYIHKFSCVLSDSVANQNEHDEGNRIYIGKSYIIYDEGQIAICNTIFSQFIWYTALVEGLYVIFQPGLNIYAEIKNVKWFAKISQVIISPRYNEMFPYIYTIL